MYQPVRTCFRTQTHIGNFDLHTAINLAKFLHQNIQMIDLQAPVETKGWN
jgi:hypothetical protein